MLSLRDWVGCKEAQIIATLMRSIAHQCASRQDPPLSWMAKCQANLGWRQNKAIIYPFYIHFQSNDSFRCLSKNGQFFFVSYPQFDFLLYLRTWIDKSVGCNVVSYALFTFLVCFLNLVYLLCFDWTQNPSLFLYTCTSFGFADYWFKTFSCGYKPLNFGGHTELVLVGTNPGGGNVDLIQKGGGRFYI